ncbi:Iron-sulfur cluster assembly scaffold protein IscU 2 [uncultured archaeon]|nr:Iron-sulfur cluster assembly scaffold protein IscU 2 [uncultured archaeon]
MVTSNVSYTKKMMAHFANPHNMGRLDNPDGVGKAGNPVCGDVMHLHIKVKNNKITDIKFQTLGCASAIATSSMVTDLAKGKTIDEALRITNARVASELGGLPPIKMHCSVLAEQALHSAIEDYRKRHPHSPAKPAAKKGSAKPKEKK